MNEALPAVPRYNEWGMWTPLQANCSVEEWMRVTGLGGSRMHQAVVRYCAFTGYKGIEFVLLSTASDEAPFRVFPGGLTLVRLTDVSSRPPSQLLIYDGWLPLSETTDAAIDRGIQEIDHLVCVLGHAYAAPMRWTVKYVEAVRDPTRIVSLSDGDHAAASRLLDSMPRIPEKLRASLVRSLHWKQHSSTQLRPTDELLALWQALESVLLSFYDAAPELGLALPGIPVVAGP